MAVYTEASHTEIADWLRDNYGRQDLRETAPISEGIENSNYKLVSDGDALVLTIFEVWDRERVEDYSALCSHLARKGFPVPEPIPMTDGNCVGSVKEKPTLLVPFKEGASVEEPDEGQCRRMGRIAAQLHEAAETFERSWDNPRGFGWWWRALERMRPRLNETLGVRLFHEVTALIRLRGEYVLPQAVCHCDLFKNNVLWSDSENISAIIDFYFGGRDTLVFDLAVCANDWCVGADGEHDMGLLAALLEGYESVRPLEGDERKAFPFALREAALRFWLSRLYDVHYPRRAKLLTPHNPKRFELIHHGCARRAEDVRRLLSR